MAKYEVEFRNIMESECDTDTVLVSALVEQLYAAVAEMPEECRAGAFVKLRAYGDYASGYLELLRLETDEEMAKRVAGEAERRRVERLFSDAAEERQSTFV